MADGQTIDYDALAQKHGGTAVIDYDALAAKHGGAAAAETAASPPETWWQGVKRRLSEGFAGPEKAAQGMTESGQLLDEKGQPTSAGTFTAPGAKNTPLAQGISEAGAASSLAVAGDVMGQPQAVAGLKGVATAAKETPGAIRDAAALVGRTPEGKLRPIIKVGSRLAGAGIGHEVGGVEGAVVGGLTGQQLAEAVIPNRTNPNPPGWVVKLPGRMQKSAAAKAAGSTAAAAEKPSVVIVQEPRAALPTERPGAMYSVPREQLPGLAAQGRPGAGDVLQATGQTVLYEPGGGTGYPPPRQSVSIAEMMRQRAQAQAIEKQAPQAQVAAPPPATVPAATVPGNPESVARYLRQRQANASGESAASQEAISRVASEKAGQIKRFRIDTRSGKEIPLVGVDAVDATPGPYDVIVKRGPKGEEILDTGAKARPYKPKGAQK